MFAALAVLVLSSLDVRAEGCGSVAAVRDEVRTRLGRDPDAMPGATRFEVDVTRRGTLFEARMTTIAASGTSSRTFTSPDCRELIESVGLAISITLDPSILLEPAPEPPALRAPAPPAPTPAARPAPAPSLVELSIGPLAAASAGVSGPVTFCGGLSIGVLNGPWWLGLEGRIEVPVMWRSQVSSFATLGTISPGWRHKWFRLSVPISGGAMLVTGAGQTPKRDSRLVVLAGVETAFSWSPLPQVSVEPFVRAQVSATRITVLAGTETVWVTWPLAMLAGVALRFSFPVRQ